MIDTIQIDTSYYQELMLELANLRHQKELTNKLVNELKPLLEMITPPPEASILDYIQWIQAAKEKLYFPRTMQINVNHDNKCPICGELFISIPRLGIFHKCDIENHLPQ